MNNEKIINRFQMIMTKDDMVRMNIYQNKNGNQVVQFDLHGYNRKTAERQIKNIIAVIPQECYLEIIHGYNNGTVLKELINSELKNDRIAERIAKKNNPGVTTVHIKEKAC